MLGPTWNIYFYNFRCGLAVPFASNDERTEMFKKMDDNGDGSISFDEWLAFSLEHIIAKVNFMNFRIKFQILSFIDTIEYLPFKI